MGNTQGCFERGSCRVLRTVRQNQITEDTQYEGRHFRELTLTSERCPRELILDTELLDRAPRHESRKTQWERISESGT